MGSAGSRLWGDSAPTFSLSDICERMLCLIACRAMRKTQKKKISYQMNHLLEKLCCKPDRPSALGGVNKLYRAACRYGVKRSQVLCWLQQQPAYTLHRPARKRFRLL